MEAGRVETRTSVSAREDTLRPPADARRFLLWQHREGRVEPQDDICSCGTSLRKKLGTGGLPRVTSPASCRISAPHRARQERGQRGTGQGAVVSQDSCGET